MMNHTILGEAIIKQVDKSSALCKFKVVTTDETISLLTQAIVEIIRYNNDN